MKASAGFLLLLCGSLGASLGQEPKIEESDLVGIWERRTSFGKIGKQLCYLRKVEAGGKMALAVERTVIEPGHPAKAKVELRDRAETTWSLNNRELTVGAVNLAKIGIKSPEDTATILHLSSNLLVTRSKTGGDLTVTVKTDGPQKPKVLKTNPMKIGKYTLKGNVVVGILPERSVQVTGRPATAMWVDEDKHINYAIGTHIEYHAPSKAIIVRGSPSFVSGVTIVENKKAGGIGVLLPDGETLVEDGSLISVVGRDPTEEMEFGEEK